jgi:Tol biopolymer transport system component
VSNRSDIYLLDLTRGSRQRLTAARETDASPIWSPDGTRVVFRSNRDRVHDLYARTVIGSAPEQIFFKSPLFKYPTSWSPNGRSVFFHAKDGAQWDVWLAPADGPGGARRLIQTPFDEMQAQISPDGRYIAYTSNESSALEVYVQPVDGDGPRWLVSAGGGSDPKWGADRAELYYLAPTGWLMAVKVPVATAAPEPPRALFRAVPPIVAEPYTSVYDVARDGSRFLFRVSTEDARTVPLRVRLESTDSSAAR